MKRIVGLAIAALLVSAVAANAQDTGGPHFDTGTSVEGGNTAPLVTGSKVALKAARAARNAKKAANQAKLNAATAVGDTGGPHFDTGGPSAEAGTPNVLRTNARRPRG